MGTPLPVPAPERFRVAVPFEASLVMVAVALKAATASGANEMLIDVLCPASIASGRVVGAKEKYWLEIAILAMVTVADPEFVSVAERVLLLPTETPRKSRVDADRESVPICCWLSDFPTLNPWQPANKMSAAKRSTTSAALEGRLEETALAVIFRIVSRRPLPRDSATVCARGMATNELGAPDRIAVDVRGTPQPWSEGQ